MSELPLDLPIECDLQKQLNDRPEIKWKEKLEIDSTDSGDFDGLATAARTLIEAVPLKLKDCMRMELNKVACENDRTQWELVIKVSTVFWFDRHLSKIYDDNNRLNIALKYLESEREDISYSINSYIENDKIEVFQKEYCRHLDNCINRPGIKRNDRPGYKRQTGKPFSPCPKEHPTIVCHERVERRGGSYSSECGWYYCKELQLLEPDNFILMVRPESYRDLLLLPNPGKERPNDWKGHYTNSELITMPILWEACFKKIRELACYMGTYGANIIQKVALNFGTWESAMSLDRRAIDCHGHAHIELERDAAMELSKKFRQLKGRTGDPEDYREKNCNELEINRLNSIQFKNLRTDVSLLKTDVSLLKTDVSLLKTDVSLLKTDIKSINSRMTDMDSRLADMDSRMTNMDSRMTNMDSSLTEMKNNMDIIIQLLSKK